MNPIRRLAWGALALLAAIAAALGASFAFAPLSNAPVIDTAPAAAPPPPLRARADGKAVDFTVTRIAHASVLLDFGGTVVLTDPWFSEKMHYHHGEPLGLAVEQLPRLAAVVASHAHYDHFDIETFARYPHKDVPFFVGPDMADAARAAGFTQVRELKPWETATVGALTITAAPAAHKVPEVTFVIQAHGATVFFGADTRLIPELREELPKRFPSVQLALLAINGLKVLGEQVVMNAEQAAELAGVIGAEVAVPIHYRFHGSAFTDGLILRYDGTPERFVSAMKTASPSASVRVLAPGQTLRLMWR